jgi:hypothetical protein
MKVYKLYRYIGYNGTITSPIVLPNIDKMVVVELRADPGKILTNGTRTAYSTIVSEDEVQEWTEIDD